jgi:hypothetical protein
MYDAALEEKMQLQLHATLCKQLHTKDLLLEQQKALLEHKDEALAAATSELQHCKRLLACQQLVTMSSTVRAESPKRQRSAPAAPVETAAAAALRKDSNLGLIFSFVGTGEWCFLADVDRRWRGLYLSHCVRSAGEKKFVTSVRAAFMSESRLLWAISSGLRVRGVRFDSDNMNAELICRYSLEPEYALGVAKLNGCQWTTELTAAGACLCSYVYSACCTAMWHYVALAVDISKVLMRSNVLRKSNYKYILLESVHAIPHVKVANATLCISLKV